MTANAEFWRGRRVLVTGADGFIGSHLTERLVALGASVRAFCLYNSNGHLGWLEEADREVRERLDVVLGDIRDSRVVDTACEGIDVVFHLAALISIPYSYRAPESYVDTNVKGTLHVLEAARRRGVKRVVHTSTSEVYGTPAEIPILETHPLQGQSPYSATKIAADKLCESYYDSFGVPVVVLRPFNTYGPRQSLRAVLPTILAQLLKGAREIKLGRLDPRRDLTFVGDTVEGFLAAGRTEGVEGQVIQLGTGRAVSIGELFDLCCREAGVDARPLTEAHRVRPDKSEVMVLLSDPSRARTLLGWEARVSLEHGVKDTAAWLRPRLDRHDVRSYVV